MIFLFLSWGKIFNLLEIAALKAPLNFSIAHSFILQILMDLQLSSDTLLVMRVQNQIESLPWEYTEASSYKLMRVSY